MKIVLIGNTRIHSKCPVLRCPGDYAGRDRSFYAEVVLDFYATSHGQRNDLSR